MINESVLKHLKSFDWQTIIARCSGLEDMNDRQWRFMKGLVAELIVEKYSGPDGLKYVGADHMDYVWPSRDLTVELKSVLSGTMHKKSGKLRKRYSVRLSNTQGTNTKDAPPPEHVCDLLIVVMRDGAFVIDRETVIKNAVHCGAGFDVIVNSKDVVPLTGVVTPGSVFASSIKQDVMKVIMAAI